MIRDGKPVKISYVPAENPNAPRQLKAEKIAWPFFSVLIPIDMHPAPGSPAEKAGVKEGDEVVVFSPEPGNDLETMARVLDTIPYEIMTSVSGRVKRIYLKE